MSTRICCPTTARSSGPGSPPLYVTVVVQRPGANSTRALRIRRTWVGSHPGAARGAELAKGSSQELTAAAPDSLRNARRLGLHCNEGIQLGTTSRARNFNNPTAHPTEPSDAQAGTHL